MVPQSERNIDVDIVKTDNVFISRIAHLNLREDPAMIVGIQDVGLEIEIVQITND